jgi:hypothetical protein
VGVILVFIAVVVFAGITTALTETRIPTWILAFVALVFVVLWGRHVSREERRKGASSGPPQSEGGDGAKPKKHYTKYKNPS